MIKKINKKLFFRLSIVVASVIGIFTNITKEKPDTTDSVFKYSSYITFETAHGGDGGGDSGDSGASGGVAACDGGGPAACDGGAGGSGDSVEPGSVGSSDGASSASPCTPDLPVDVQNFNNSEYSQGRYGHRKENNPNIECGRNVDITVDINAVNN